jgi:hypothetical protein
LRTLFTALALAAGLLVPAVATAAPASASERTCYTPHVAGFDTYEVCYFLPIEPTQ